jgi:hypothetical protein
VRPRFVPSWISPLSSDNSLCRDVMMGRIESEPGHRSYVQCCVDHFGYSEFLDKLSRNWTGLLSLKHHSSAGDPATSADDFCISGSRCCRIPGLELTGVIAFAQGRIRPHRGSSTLRLLCPLWLGDPRAIAPIFQYAYVGPAEPGYRLALSRSRNTDSAQRKTWPLACRATRPRPAPQVGSTGHRRQARSVHLPPFSRDRWLRTCPPQNASSGSFWPKWAEKLGQANRYRLIGTDVRDMGLRSLSPPLYSPEPPCRAAHGEN